MAPTRKNKKACWDNGHRKWDDMGNDILAHIFTFITYQDLLYNVSLVCSAWKKVCWDMFFWKSKETLDFSSLRYAMLNSDYFLATEDYDALSLRWMQLLHRTMIEEERVQLVRNLVFGFDTELSDKHLVFVAQRTPELKKLNLPAANRISGKGFSRAIRNWKALEEILLGRTNYVYHDHIILEIGINCKKLKSLCLDGSYSLSAYKSVLLIENLKSLKQLTLQNLLISEEGLLVLLSKFKGLDKLHIKYCNGLDICKGMETSSKCFFSWWEMEKTRLDKQIKWSITTEEGLYSPGDMVNLLWERGQ